MSDNSKDMNESPVYCVRGRLTYTQRARFYHLVSCAVSLEKAIAAIGVPIQPCADVETIGWLDPALLDALRVNRDTLLGVTLANIATPTRNIPLVRRTDMEAQVARVAAAKGAELETWRTRYECIRWRFLQDAKLEKRALTAAQFDAFVDGDDEARAALNEGVAS